MNYVPSVLCVVVFRKIFQNVAIYSERSCVESLLSGLYEQWYEYRHCFCGALSGICSTFYFNTVMAVSVTGLPLTPELPSLAPGIASTSATILLPDTYSIPALHPVYRYIAVVEDVSTGTQTASSTSVDETSLVLAGLTPSTSYQVRLQALSSIGTSSFTAPVLFRTLSPGNVLSDWTLCQCAQCVVQLYTVQCRFNGILLAYRHCVSCSSLLLFLCPWIFCILLYLSLFYGSDSTN